MDAEETQFLSTLVDKTDSDLVLVIIVLSVVVAVAGKPLYKMFTDSVAGKRAREEARETRLITVIQDNSSVMAELKTILQGSESNCKDCKTMQLARFQHLEDKMQAVHLTLNEVKRDNAVCINAAQQILTTKGVLS